MKDLPEYGGCLVGFFLPLPAGDAGSVCSGQQPRRSDAAEAGGADGPQSESHTGQNVPLLNWTSPVFEWTELFLFSCCTSLFTLN